MNAMSGPDAAAGFVAHRVDVQVGQVAVAQRDQVAEGAQVGLQGGDRAAVASHGEGQGRFLPGPQRRRPRSR